MFHGYCADQSVSPTPRPLPASYFDKEGTQREADDVHPRARLTALHKQKAIIVNDAASIEAFSNIYILLKKVLLRITLLI